MNFRNFTLIDWVTIFGIIASAALVFIFGSGCALHAKVYTDKNEMCCERLDVRLTEMDEFNRYCMMMVFADRKETDPKVKEDIQRRLNLCKFVLREREREGEREGDRERSIHTLFVKHVRDREVSR